MSDTAWNNELSVAVGRLPKDTSFQELIKYKSNIELAKRTLASYTIILIYVLFATITPFFKDHGTTAVIIGVILGSSLLVRAVIAKNISSPEKLSQSVWLRNYSLSTIWVAGTWAAFQCSIYYFFQVTWMFYLSTICTIGISATATTTLAPHAKLARIYSFVIVSPTILVGVIDRTRPAITMSILLVIFMVAIMMMIKSNYHLYRNSLITIEELNIQKGDLENIISRVTENSSKLKEASANLSDISGEMSNSAENMSQKSSSASSSVKELKANSKTTSDAMAQLRESADRLAGLTGEMTNSISVISENTENTDTIAQEAVSQARSVTENVHLLGESARQVGNISETIEEISSQTNLLALNATIAAARAGDAGKGFAVVANEIKTLASQTAEATQQIKNQINAIQSAISETVSEINRISSITMEIGESTAISAASVKEQADMARTIASGVSEASETVTIISTHADRTLATTDQIAKNISMVADAVYNVVEHSMNVEKSAEALMGQAKELNELITTSRNR
jgi:methyl-accepting chemotaxis protein